MRRRVLQPTSPARLPTQPFQRAARLLHQRLELGLGVAPSVENVRVGVDRLVSVVEGLAHPPTLECPDRPEWEGGVVNGRRQTDCGFPIPASGPQETNGREPLEAALPTDRVGQGGEFG